MNQTHRPYITMGPTPPTIKNWKCQHPVPQWMFEYLQYPSQPSSNNRWSFLLVFLCPKVNVGSLGSHKDMAPRNASGRPPETSMYFIVVVPPDPRKWCLCFPYQILNLIASYIPWILRIITDMHHLGPGDPPQKTRRTQRLKTHAASCQDTRYICKPHYNLDYKTVNSSR